MTNNQTITLRNFIKYVFQGYLFDSIPIYLNDIYNDGLVEASFSNEKSIFSGLIYNGRNIAREFGYPYLGGFALGCLKGIFPLFFKNDVSSSLLFNSCMTSGFNSYYYEKAKDDFPDSNYFVQAQSAIEIEVWDGTLNGFNEPDNIINSIHDGFRIGILVAIANPIYDFIEENFIDNLSSEDQTFGFIRDLYTELFYVSL